MRMKPLTLSDFCQKCKTSAYNEGFEDGILGNYFSDEDEVVLKNVALKFTSGNQIPIERAVITAKEWGVIKRYLPTAPEGD